MPTATCGRQSRDAGDRRCGDFAAPDHPAACARIARAAFELASERRKHVTIVHKANVLRLGDGMFLEECRKARARFSGYRVDDVIVDAMMAHLVRNPAAVRRDRHHQHVRRHHFRHDGGSRGQPRTRRIAESGADYAMAQASHGSAPDIAGRNIANPFSLILSVALLLAWHGRKKAEPGFADAAAAIERRHRRRHRGRRDHARHWW